MDRTTESQRANPCDSDGDQRLLPDLALVGHANADRLPAQERLEDLLGVDLTRRLVKLLRRDPPSQLRRLEHPQAA